MKGKGRVRRYLEILPDKKWRILSIWSGFFGLKDYKEKGKYGKYQDAASLNGFLDDELSVILKTPCNRTDVENIARVCGDIFMDQVPNWSQVNLVKDHEIGPEYCGVYISLSIDVLEDK